MGMQEKDMVNDVLTMTKSSMSDYTKAIGECSNTSLRNALTQLRAEAEQFQNQLGNVATQKGYYPSSQKATQQDKQQLKSQLSQGMTGTTTGQGMTSGTTSGGATGRKNRNNNRPGQGLS